MKTIAHPYISQYPRRTNRRRRSWGLMPRLRPSLGFAILSGWLAAFALAWLLTWATCELHKLIH